MFAGDVIRAINSEAVDRLDQTAVRMKFEQAQYASDHIVLAMERNGNEILSAIHLLADYYQPSSDAKENGIPVQEGGAHQSLPMSHQHNAILQGNAAPIANFSFPGVGFGFPPRSSIAPGEGMGRWSHNAMGLQQDGRRWENRGHDAISPSQLAGHSPARSPRPTRLVYPPPSPAMGKNLGPACRVPVVPCMYT